MDKNEERTFYIHKSFIKLVNGRNVVCSTNEKTIETRCINSVVLCFFLGKYLIINIQERNMPLVHYHFRSLTYNDRFCM